MKVFFKEIVSKGIFRKTSKVVFVEKDVPITLKIGTLEDLGEDLGIEFYEIGDLMKKDAAALLVNLLYHGYITHCKESFTRPIYTKEDAAFWFENLSVASHKELADKIKILFGEMQKSKKKVEQNIN